MRKRRNADCIIWGKKNLDLRRDSSREYNKIPIRYISRLCRLIRHHFSSRARRVVHRWSNGTVALSGISDNMINARLLVVFVETLIIGRSSWNWSQYHPPRARELSKGRSGTWPHWKDYHLCYLIVAVYVDRFFPHAPWARVFIRPTPESLYLPYRCSAGYNNLDDPHVFKVNDDKRQVGPIFCSIIRRIQKNNI